MAKPILKSMGKAGGAAAVSVGAAEAIAAVVGLLTGDPDTAAGVQHAAEGVTEVAGGDASGVQKIFNGLFKIAVGFGIFGLRRRMDRSV